MRILCIFALLVLAGCSSAGGDYRYEFARQNVTPPENYGAFQHCRGYGCKYVENVTLSRKEWREITAPMRPFFHEPAEERAAIAKTIGRFEKKIGKMIGTDGDVFGTFAKLGDKQLDCVDESINTTTYLILLENAKLLKFHDVSAIETRAPLAHGLFWPHRTAVIVEKESGDRYVVDSWFHDNGHDAETLLVSDWKNGWKPEETKTNDNQ